MTEVKAVSALVAQGWEIVSYSASTDHAGNHSHSLLLRRQKQHKILQLRTKWIGSGLVAKEIDV